MQTIPYPPEHIEDGIGFLVNQLSYELRQAATRECAYVGCKTTPEGLGIMFLLSRNEGLTQSNISTLLAKDKAMITRLLNSLVEEGLVRRDQDESDRRVVRSYLTDKGKKLLEEIIPSFRSFFGELYAGVDADDFAIARNVISRMIANLRSLQTKK